MKRFARRATAPLVLGVAVIAVGVLFTLQNLGLVNAAALLRLWPVVLLALGIVYLTNGRWIGAFAWLTVGSLLLLNNLDVTDIDIFQLWPLILIVVGLNIVRKALGRSRSRDGESASEVRSLAFLSGQSHKCTCSEFDCGDVTAILGGSEVDLRRAEMVNGERVVDVFALWGGVDIKVPRSWSVIGRVNTFLGGFDDRTDHSQADPNKRLVVQGMAVMGGVEVSN